MSSQSMRRDRGGTPPVAEEVERLKAENTELKAGFAELSRSHVAQGARMDALTATLVRVQALVDAFTGDCEAWRVAVVEDEDAVVSLVTYHLSMADVYREAAACLEAALRGGDGGEENKSDD